MTAIPEDKRDPLVAVLTERTAQAIRRERELDAGNLHLRLEIGKWKARCRQLQRQVDMLIERDAARAQ